jgi:hypothetical protein
MRELHAVFKAGYHFPDRNLTRISLLSDKFVAVDLSNFMRGAWRRHEAPTFYDDLEFLIDKGLVVHENESLASGPNFSYPMALGEWEFLKRNMGLDVEIKNHAEMFRRMQIGDDLTSRMIANQLQIAGVNAVAVCNIPLPEAPDPVEGRSGQSDMNVLQIGVECCPAPGDECSWGEILDFRSEMRRKLLGLRRFLRDAVTKKQTAAELQEAIEVSLDEYTKAMDRLKLKRSISFMETYIVPIVEAFESFKPSMVVKGIVSIKKRRLELLEGEANAPGREVAYIYDARKRFGQ